MSENVSIDIESPVQTVTRQRTVIIFIRKLAYIWRPVEIDCFSFTFLLVSLIYSFNQQCDTGLNWYILFSYLACMVGQLPIGFVKIGCIFWMLGTSIYGQVLLYHAEKCQDSLYLTSVIYSCAFFYLPIVRTVLFMCIKTIKSCQTCWRIHRRKEAIDRIYQYLFTGLEPIDTCSICLEEYIQGDSIRRLRCTHEFHTNCIDGWLGTNGTCPLCRELVV